VSDNGILRQSARLRSRLRISDAFGLIRGDLIAAINDRAGFWHRKADQFYLSRRGRTAGWNTTIAMGGQATKANAECHQDSANSFMRRFSRSSGVAAPPPACPIVVVKHALPPAGMPYVLHEWPRNPA
jgi:hypothetical protein